jgi:His-Xaa-Ser system radical SAM maturase HxsC
VLLQLHGRHLRPLSAATNDPFICRISERQDLPDAARGRECLLLRSLPTGPIPAGFRAYLLHCKPADTDGLPPDCYALGEKLHHLQHGDVVRIESARAFINVLYRRTSSSNSLLVTERCDNYCIMCSQPPRTQDDSWIVDELRQVIPLMSPDTREIGITGGEPALLRDRLPELLELMKRHLPTTAVHILSNGRGFSDLAFARQLAEVRHADLMVGIPVYSDLPEEHDFVVQQRGAFSETIRGILNLKRVGLKVELRFVIQRETSGRLPEFAKFVARNLLFVDHVALMGLELMGFARTNLEAVWVDPLDYQPHLVEATRVLDRAGLRVSIYNHQLCVLDAALHRYARQSISDWKNAYAQECNNCDKRSECGGLFASSHVRMSRGIRGFQGGKEGSPRATSGPYLQSAEPHHQELPS